MINKTAKDGGDGPGAQRNEMNWILFTQPMYYMKNAIIKIDQGIVSKRICGVFSLVGVLWTRILLQFTPMIISLEGILNFMESILTGLAM